MTLLDPPSCRFSILGNVTEEFMILQTEMVLGQKCLVMIEGQSGFGEMLREHMCCNMPLAPRGLLPKRCLCPPTVSLDQFEFDCDTGNKLLCDGINKGGNIMLPLDLPSNMLGANFSTTRAVYRDNPKVHYKSIDAPTISFNLADMNSQENYDPLHMSLNASVTGLCNYHTNRKSFKFCG